MSKDAYYFSHDSNAKDDPKCTMLIEQLGLEGYGIFWVLIEILRDQPNYKYPVALISALARKYNTTAEKMKTVVNGYGLFEVDEKDFFSLSLLNRMGKYTEKRDKAIAAANKRWNKQLCESNADAMQTHSEGNADSMPNKVNQIKSNQIISNESKVNEINLPDNLPLPPIEINTESIINTKCPTCKSDNGSCFLKEVRGHATECGSYNPVEAVANG